MNTDTDFFQPAMQRIATMLVEDIAIVTLDKESEGAMAEVITRNMEPYQEAGGVLAATWRRIQNLHDTYNKAGNIYITLRHAKSNELIGGAGLGSLAGLPSSEGKGEIRDLVIEERFRGRGLGKLLLKECLKKAREFGYQTVYLETTPQMEYAQRLFRNFGFRAIREKTESVAPGEDRVTSLPCYFLLEDIEAGIKQNQSK